MSDSATLIFGIGSPHGDDRFGWEVIRRLQQQWPAARHDGCFSDDRSPECLLIPLASPVDLLNHLGSQRRVVICDACWGLSQTGDIRSFDWPDEAIEHLSGSGSHDFSLVDTLRLAERLQRLPPQVTIWVAERTSETIPTSVIEQKLSPPVAKAVEQVVSHIAEEHSYA